MRKGATLLELVASLPVLAAASTVAVLMFGGLIGQLPIARQAASQHACLTHLLERIGRDVEGSMAVECPDDNTGRPGRLVIRTEASSIEYRLTEEGVARYELDADGSGPVRTDQWDLPHAAVSFRPHVRNAVACAVEVSTAVICERLGKTETRLANNHIFFPAAKPKARRP